jgi:hypothetical protein
MSVDRDAVLEGFDHLTGEGFGRSFVTGICDQDGEFVASHASQDVSLSDDGLENASRFLQNTVTQLLAERVVDALEPIQVPEAQGDGRPLRSVAPEGVFQFDVHPGTICDPGQFVVVGCVLELSSRQLDRRRLCIESPHHPGQPEADDHEDQE